MNGSRLRQRPIRSVSSSPIRTRCEHPRRGNKACGYRVACGADWFEPTVVLIGDEADLSFDVWLPTMLPIALSTKVCLTPWTDSIVNVVVFMTVLLSKAERTRKDHMESIGIEPFHHDLILPAACGKVATIDPFATTEGILIRSSRSDHARNTADLSEPTRPYCLTLVVTQALSRRRSCWEKLAGGSPIRERDGAPLR